MIAKTPRHLRVFLSSPGDLKAERDAADRVLEELPRLPAWKGKFTIDPVRWDDPHAPAPMDAHLTPQDAVNRGLPKPSECDIVVVILWGRMGTPLPGSYKKPNGDSYVSGTEWEYEDARQAGKHLLLYRCTEKTWLAADDPDYEEKRRQYRLVGEFFKRFEAPDGSLTGGYTGYATTTEFTHRFRQDMEGLLRQWDDEPSEKKNLGPQGPVRAAPVSQAYRDWLKHDCGGVELLGMRLRHGQAVRVHHIYVPITARSGELAAKAADLGSLVASHGRKLAERPQLVLNSLEHGSLYLNGDRVRANRHFAAGWPGSLVRARCPRRWSSFRRDTPRGFPRRCGTAYRSWSGCAISGAACHSCPRAATCPVRSSKRHSCAGSRPKDLTALHRRPCRPTSISGRPCSSSTGLTEVPVTAGAGVASWAPRSLLISGLKHACPEWTKTGNRILLTSRPYGLAAADTPKGLSHVPIELLPDELQTVLIERWFRVLAESEEAARATARDMQVHLGEHRWLTPLTANPLLLTAMCIIYDEGKRLPEDKHDLYDRIVDTVLHGRYRVAKDAARNRLGVIAHGMHTGEGLAEARATPQAEATYAEIERMLKAYKAKSSWSEEAYLGAIETREELLSQSGLLLPSGDKRARFYHLSFQEFLAAQRILEITDDNLIGVFRERATAPDWRNTLSLLFGRVLGTRVSPERGIRLIREMIALIGPETIGLTLVAADCIEGLLAKGIRLPEGEETRFRVILLRDLQGDAAAVDRASLGASLARLGDPRFEVLDPDEMQFCFVPKGEFRLGSGDEDEMAFDDEKTKGRAQRYQLDYGYWMARFPVTNAQFLSFVKDKGYGYARYWAEAQKAGVWRAEQVQGTFDAAPRTGALDLRTPFGLANYPVVGITWYEALAYTRWLTERWRGTLIGPDQEVALPSEPEWEKAARGGLEIIQADSEHARPRPARSGLPSLDVSKDQFAPNAQPERRYPWGRDPDINKANYADTGIGATSAVGIFPGGESPYGCEGMSGNVWEWTRSLWGAYPYPKRPAERLKREALDERREKSRVVRGGGFHDNPRGVRCADRYRGHPDAHHRDLGFRVVVRPLL